MDGCDHHYCTFGCLYGGENLVVTSQIPNAWPYGTYQGMLCCKCHHLVILDLGDTPVTMTEECRVRWNDYDQKVDEYIKQHGPLGA